MKTIIQVEIEHTRPLAGLLIDALAEKAYTFLHNKQVPCDVTARLLEVKPQPLKPWEVV